MRKTQIRAEEHACETCRGDFPQAEIPAKIRIYVFIRRLLFNGRHLHIVAVPIEKAPRVFHPNE